MWRAVIEAAIPFLIPFALYAIWVRVSRNAAPSTPARLHPWVWLSVAGLVLAFAVLVVTSRRERMGAGEHYEPAHFRNGEIVQGGAR